LDVTKARVEYSIKQLEIEPQSRVGLVRQFDSSVVEQLRADIFNRNPPPKSVAD